MSKTYYDILQVNNNAEESVIKAAYKVLIQKNHPDKNKELEEQIRLQEQKKHKPNNLVNTKTINNEQIYWQHILEKHKEIQDIENQYLLKRKQKNKKMFSLA